MLTVDIAELAFQSKGGAGRRRSASVIGEAMSLVKQLSAAKQAEIRDFRVRYYDTAWKSLSSAKTKRAAC
jgi:hypothetical protein